MGASLSGYPRMSTLYPFAIELPADAGFGRCEVVELEFELARVHPYASQRLQSRLARFNSLAETGALCGRGIDPWTSGLRFLGVQQPEELLFVAHYRRVAIDDAAYTVLINLIAAARRRLPVSVLRIRAGLGLGRTLMLPPDEAEPAFPARFQPLPFDVDDEEPETDALLFDLEFKQAPTPATVAAFDAVFDSWASVVKDGGFALAPYPPEDSHVECYVDGLTVLGLHAEVAYHKIRAADAAIDAAINMVAALHKRIAAVASLRLA